MTAVNNSVYCFESRWFVITRAVCACSLLSEWMLQHWSGRGKWQSYTNKCTCNKAVRDFSGCFSVADAGPPRARSLALHPPQLYHGVAVINIRQVASDYAVLPGWLRGWQRLNILIWQIRWLPCVSFFSWSSALFCLRMLLSEPIGTFLRVLIKSWKVAMSPNVVFVLTDRWFRNCDLLLVDLVWFVFLCALVYFDWILVPVTDQGVEL